VSPTRWIWRGYVCLAAAVLLPAGMALGFGDPYREAPQPPFPDPTVVVTFTWQPVEDLRFHYLLIPEVEDPLTDSFGAASWYAGCLEGALDPEPVVPLVLQSGSEPARNWATGPGTYWVAAESDGYCLYLDDPDRLDRTLAAIPEGTEISVTATIESYEAGAGGARTDVLSASIPVFLDVRDLPATRRVLGSVTLAPGESIATTTSTRPDQSTVTTAVGSGTAESTTTTSAGDAGQGTSAAREPESEGTTSRVGLFVAVILILIALGMSAWIKFWGIDRWFGRKAREGDLARKPPPPPPQPNQKTYQTGEKPTTYVTTIQKAPPEPPPEPIRLRGEKKWNFRFIEGRTDGGAEIRFESGTRAVVLEREGRLVKLRTLSPTGPDVWVNAKYVESINPPAPAPPPPPPE